MKADDTTSSVLFQFRSETVVYIPDRGGPVSPTGHQGFPEGVTVKYNQHLKIPMKVFPSLLIKPQKKLVHFVKTRHLLKFYFGARGWRPGAGSRTDSRNVYDRHECVLIDRHHTWYTNREDVFTIRTTSDVNVSSKVESCLSRRSPKWSS